MRWTELTIPTLREDPSEAEAINHKRLLRAGYVRQESAGVFRFLPLAERTFAKMAALLPGLRREEHVREDVRTKGGLIRLRQFHTLSSDAAVDFTPVFARCGLRLVAGTLFASPYGDDFAVVCPPVGYAAPQEIAVADCVPPEIADPEGDREPERFHTPGQKTIADIAAFTGLPETSQMKSVVLMCDGRMVLVLVRGDHQLSEAKLLAVTGASALRPATGEELQQRFGASAGSLGPVGVTDIPVYADLALQGRRNMICGANVDDYHLRHVTPGEDFHPIWADLRVVTPRDTIAGYPVEFVKAFALASRRSLGMERLLAAAVEQFADDAGFCLPPAIAPFGVVITPVNYTDPAQREAAVRLYDEAAAAGLDPLLDDRDDRPGTKFKDAELIGIPFRITIGKKLPQGLVEMVSRRTRAAADVPLGEAVEAVRKGWETWSA